MFSRSCYERFNHSIAASFARLVRPHCLDRQSLEFSGADQGYGLAACPDFMSVIGVLLPIAPWGVGAELLAMEIQVRWDGGIRGAQAEGPGG